jgi:hypothetical protein
VTAIDPVCLFHGKRRSEHHCLYCAICFVTLTPEECWRDADGVGWDLCRRCGDLASPTR